jgi:hypothetical protein
MNLNDNFHLLVLSQIAFATARKIFSLEDVALLDLVFSLSVLYHDIMNLPERYAIVLLYAPMVIYIATRHGCYKTPDLTGL